MTATPPMVRALRGAITVDRDDPAEVRAATSEMLATLMQRNAVAIDDIISLMFTATQDLTSEFPAVAAREMGMNRVPLMCAAEIDVPGALPQCIRVMFHCYLPADRAPRHVYLRGARALRADLADESDVQ